MLSQFVEFEGTHFNNYKPICVNIASIQYVFESPSDASSTVIVFSGGEGENSARVQVGEAYSQITTKLRRFSSDAPK